MRTLIATASFLMSLYLRIIYTEIPAKIKIPNPQVSSKITDVSEHGFKIYKDKSYSFKVAEGIAKNDDTNIDIEEVA